MSHKIEWTDATWNVCTGCTKLSPGCDNCYAARMAKRLKAMGQQKYSNGFRLTMHESELSKPSEWRKPCLVFVNSMSDLFHEDVSVSFLKRVFSVMGQTQQHQFQVLTKRAARLAELSGEFDWTPNIWTGVTIEHNDYVHRADYLRQVPASLRFLSIEPMLGPVPDLNLDGIGWLIVGGESGPGARPIEADWVRDVRDKCVDAEIPFFFKQWGGVNKKKNGKLLDGYEWLQMPDISR